MTWDPATWPQPLIIALLAAVLAFVLAQLGAVIKRSLDRGETARVRRETFAAELLTRSRSWSRSTNEPGTGRALLRQFQPEIRIPEILVLHEPFLTRRMVSWFVHEEFHLMVLLDLNPRDEVHVWNFLGNDLFRRAADATKVRARIERGLRHWMKGHRFRAWYLTSGYSGDELIFRFALTRVLFAVFLLLLSLPALVQFLFPSGRLSRSEKRQLDELVAASAEKPVIADSSVPD